MVGLCKEDGHHTGVLPLEERTMVGLCKEDTTTLTANMSSPCEERTMVGLCKEDTTTLTANMSSPCEGEPWLVSVRRTPPH